jgi:hypothetical protein
MRRIVSILAGVAVAGITAVGVAQVPGENPFPAPAVKGVFVATQTVTGPGSSLGEGALTNFFAQGSTVVFQAFAGDVKTGKILTSKDVKFFYISIPGQPPLKLTYRNDPRWPWTATWTVPSDYALGIVPFKTLIRTTAKRFGSFVQIPVATSQLTVTNT